MNLEILRIAIENEHWLLKSAVSESSTTMEAAIGVGRLLLSNGGDTSVLSSRQTYVYESCIKPLYDVDCQGVFGPDTCTGSGKVDEETLPTAWEEDDFRCQHCRHDRNRIDSE
ncbi:hypothetical protein SAMN02745124_03451 [Desulfofustis glycolicus DSM 9705]|uniref:Uncharacterized protein n=1 Tax=Desulfofustis glycolicus DSM 9705 TaxID=1121409 RepID=A0A1M5XXP5_9BACT|nr:hypothetical protein SAMN02745124_03451 [Desulfofustis glycolicus DSM 9705]